MNVHYIQTLTQTEIDFFHALKDNNKERFLEIIVLKDFNINIFYHTCSNNEHIILYDALLSEKKHERRIYHPIYSDTIYNENIKKVYSFYRTPLMLACLFGNIPFVELLLENGASINAIDPVNYETALIVAVYVQNIDMIHILLEKGSNPNQYICEYIYKKEEYDKETGGTADEEFYFTWKSTLHLAIDKIRTWEEN